MNRPSQAANSWLKCALDPSVVIRSLLMSIVVGAVLVSINHGMRIYKGHFNFTCFWQSAMTFMVPYIVSTVSSVLAMQSDQQSAS